MPRRKVITAVELQELNKNLIENHGEVLEILHHDCETQEELFDALAIHLDCEALLLVDTLKGPLSKHELITEILKNKKIKVVMVLENEDEEYRRYLRRNQITDIFTLDSPIDEIVQALLFRNVAEEIEEEQLPVTEYINNAFKTLTESVHKTEKIYIQKEVIGICSPCGGLGKTTISVNLAVLAAKKYPDCKIALVDFNEDKPDIYRAFNMENEKGLNLVEKEIKSGEFSLARVLSTMEQVDRAYPNLFLLGGLNTPDLANSFTLYHYKEIIRYLKSEYDLVIIDTGAFNTNATYSVLERSTKLLIIVSDTERSVSAVKETMDFYENRIGLPLRKKVQIFMNKVIGYEKLDDSAVEEILGVPVCCSIPQNREIAIMDEKYKPFSISNFKNRFGQLARAQKSIEKTLNTVFTYVEKKR